MQIIKAVESIKHAEQKYYRIQEIEGVNIFCYYLIGQLCIHY